MIEDLHIFKYDELIVNKQLIDEFSEHVQQKVYQPALDNENKESPIDGLNLKNNQIYMAFKKMLEAIMAIVSKI